MLPFVVLFFRAVWAGILAYAVLRGVLKVTCFFHFSSFSIVIMATATKGTLFGTLNLKFEDA